MVQFGRHVDFFVANELDSAHQLYVVPYKDVRNRTTVEQQSKACPPTPADEPVIEIDSSAVAVPPGASELSSLFVRDANPSPRVERPAKVLDAPVKKNDGQAAKTLNAGTGAELAAALQYRLALDRHGSITQPVPDDCGPGDPCNNDITASPASPGSDNIAANNLTVKAKNFNQPAKQRAGTPTGRRPSWTAAANVGVSAATSPNPSANISASGSVSSSQKTLLEWEDFQNLSEEEQEVQAVFFAQRFQTEWRICLKRASADFDRAMTLFYSEVFDSLSDKEVRGALPDTALKMFVKKATNERSHESLRFLKNIHAAALVNAEALRKLVKKFDKMQGSLWSIPDKHLLSARLLPEVYATNFTGSLASLESGLALLRVLLNVDDDDETQTSVEDASAAEDDRLEKLSTLDEDLRDITVLSGGYFGNTRKDLDEKIVRGRMDELRWLRNMVESIDPVYVPFLVGHRGFHSVHDRSDVRPLENSLMAYEAAWTNGIHLCECDIALTKDERIILAHDENFQRLGMDPSSPLANRTVRDLTFKELMSLPLKSGARPPLLFDVLRSAAAIGGNAKMIVEIKAGNSEAAGALARMFVRHPRLLDHVAVVMSFDAYVMHKLRMEMTAVYEHLRLSGQRSDQEMAGGSPNKMSAYATDESHPLGHATSSIALGSTLPNANNLSASPNLTPAFTTRRRSMSHNRSNSVSAGGGLGGHNRLDSRDFFGLGQVFDSRADLGLNLNEKDTETSTPTTFLPMPMHKGKSGIFVRDDHNADEEEKKEGVEEEARMTFPKLLLITVAETPKEEYELFLDITRPEEVAKVDSWLRGGDGGSLDGLYMQYQKPMLSAEGSKIMRGLASRFDVGIWGANPVPDDWDTFHALVSECHVSYVNSSLPKHFRRKFKRSKSTNTLVMNGILLDPVPSMDL